jgi:hypothetical protein
LAGAQPRLISSALLHVELVRVLGLARPAAIPAAERFLAETVDIARDHSPGTGRSRPHAARTQVPRNDGAARVPHSGDAAA